MSEHEARMQEMARKRVVYKIPGMEAAAIRRDITYRTTSEGALALDLYFPAANQTAEPLPIVVIVAGYPDPLGRLRKMGYAISWAQLAAASGIAAAIYATREPAADVLTVVEYLRENAPALGLDANRIGLLASSGSVPVALSALTQAEGPRCAALLCGFTMDLDGGTCVADAASAFGFVNACAGLSVDDLRYDVPLFIVRAGCDQFAGLNDATDRFVARALARNLPLTLVNHASAPHAFDLDDDTPDSRDVVEQVLRFFRFHLGAAARPGA